MVLSASEAALLKSDEKLGSAVDVTSPEQFIAAGFDVNFVGPEGDFSSVLGLCGDEGGTAFCSITQRALPPRKTKRVGHCPWRIW